MFSSLIVSAVSFSFVIISDVSVSFSIIIISAVFVSFGIVIVFADGIVKVLGVGVLIGVLVVVVERSDLKADID